MTQERIVELLNIERECVARGNTCGRTCASCELVQEDQELLEMYDTLINTYTSTIRGLRLKAQTIDDYCDIPPDMITKLIK